MKKLHWMILRSLPGPFIAALGTLVFLLLLQFLMTYLKDLVGRGLPLTVILELVAYSLAYMFVLAVPMSLLLATFLVFGRLADSQAYAVAKSTGISLYSLSWPMLIVGVMVVGGMSYFNAVMWPEANHRMRVLWQDIRVAKPGFDLEPGVFYDGLEGYSIRVDDAPTESNELVGVLIFDHSQPGQEVTLVAERGELASARGGELLAITLLDGEMHRSGTVRGEQGRSDRYERLSFDRHRLTLDVSDLVFERSGDDETIRTGRTMRASQLSAQADSVRASAEQRRLRLRDRFDWLLTEPIGDIAHALPGDTIAASTTAAVGFSPLLDELHLEEQRATVLLALQRVRALRSELEAGSNTIRWEALRADRLMVEYYKKYSMALASLVFVIIGIPLGLMVRRRGYGWPIVIAVAVFLFYWVALVQGEKLADRAVISPEIGMWTANVVGALVAIAMFIREARLPAGLLPRKD